MNLYNFHQNFKVYLEISTGKIRRFECEHIKQVYIVKLKNGESLELDLKKLIGVGGESIVLMTGSDECTKFTINSNIDETSSVGLHYLSQCSILEQTKAIFFSQTFQFFKLKKIPKNSRQKFKNWVLFSPDLVEEANQPAEAISGKINSNFIISNHEIYFRNVDDVILIATVMPKYDCSLWTYLKQFKSKSSSLLPLRIRMEMLKSAGVGKPDWIGSLKTLVESDLIGSKIKKKIESYT
jgi:hypothetical protein